MCRAIGRTDFLEDSRFSTNTDRVKHRKECVDALSGIFDAETTEHWVALIADAGVPCGPINKVSEVVSNPQVLARNMIAELDHPNIPNLKIPNSPMKLSASPSSIRRPPPLLGEHNADVLSEQGYTPEQIASLRDRGVVGG